jgi:hypothetical protein
LNRQKRTRNKTAAFPVANYEAVEAAFGVAYAEANRGAPYLGNYKHDRPALKRLFQRGVPPATLIDLCTPFMALGKSGREKDYWASKRTIAHLCANINHEALAKARATGDSPEVWE